MTVELQELKESTGTVDGLEVRVVVDEQSLHVWTNVFVKGYGLPSAWEDTVYDRWLKLGLGFPICDYNAHVCKLRSPALEKAQFVTALGIHDKGLLRLTPRRQLLRSPIASSLLIADPHSSSISRLIKFPKMPIGRATPSAVSETCVSDQASSNLKIGVSSKFEPA